jgi:hypothetical protein
VVPEVLSPILARRGERRQAESQGFLLLARRSVLSAASPATGSTTNHHRRGDLDVASGPRATFSRCPACRRLVATVDGVRQIHDLPLNARHNPKLPERCSEA